MPYGKQQERQIGARQRAQGSGGKPHRVGQPNNHVIVSADDRTRPEQGIAQAEGLRLHHVGELGAVVMVADIFEKVGFAGQDDEADLVGPAQDQALHEILGDRVRTRVAVIAAAADGGRLFRKGERLDAAAAGAAGTSPHMI